MRAMRARCALLTPRVTSLNLRMNCYNAVTVGVHAVVPKNLAASAAAAVTMRTQPRHKGHRPRQ